ncbi:MAG: HNH endonuclease [Chloroflexota bacterium]|nr:HNH endonuclease [Chloroflexota bacterium]
MINSPVLVLNQNYEPLNISRVRRALLLVMRGRAETVENGSGVIHTPDEVFDIPSVIRLLHLVKRPRQEKRLTRREVFRRDMQACQYCGKETKDLTLDHVMPRHRGGKHVWDNVVSACFVCNNRKAGRTPHEAGMNLTRQPYAPYVSGYYVSKEYLQRHDGWGKFLPLQYAIDGD